MEEASTEVPAQAPLEPATNGAGDGSFQPVLLLLFVVIVAAVAAQNIWLRRRNEAEAAKTEGDS